MNAPAPVSQIAAANEAAPGVPAPIVQPYLLVLFSVPFFVDATGRRWIDPLWAKDLLEHTRYIKRLVLAASAVHGPAPANAVAMDQVPGLRDLRCIELPHRATRLQALLGLPRTLRILWGALGDSKLVHTAVVSWPIPEAWLLMPLLWLRRRPLYINIESAFWRLVPGQPAGRVARWRAAINERVNRYCVEHSDLSTFTHEGYRRTLLQRGRERGHVVEASWIDARNLVTPSDLAARLERRQAEPARLRLVFAGRLTEAKGLRVLMDAASALLRAGVPLELDIYGEGALEAECRARSAEPDLQPWIRLRGSLPYGDPFFEALRHYDALIVPSISDEQPRIVFDAYAQGLPVIASRTPGLVQCVEDFVTGRLFEPGDLASLEALLTTLARQPRLLSDLSLSCLARAARLTHRHMHETRWRLLATAFPALTRA